MIITSSLGGTLIFSYIRRLGSFFCGFNIVNFIICRGFHKNEFFLRYEDFVNIFSWVITKLDYIKVSFLCILGSFLKVKVQMGNFFCVGKISNIFLGCLKFLIL